MWPFSSLIRESAERGGVDTEARGSSWFPAWQDLVTTPVHAGVSVDETSATNLPAVYKCVNLNAETISSLPVDAYARRGEARVPYEMPAWLASPNPFQTRAEFIAMTQTSLDLDGNCFWLKSVDASGRLVGLSVLAPTAVEVKLEDFGAGLQLVYYVATSGGRQSFSAREIVHLKCMVLPGDLRGLSPIEAAKQTIGVGLAAEEFGAKFFGAGAHPSAVVEVPGALTPEAAERLKKSLAKTHGGISQSMALGILSGGATWRPISVPPNEAQFLETRRYSAAEIANLYGVPVEFVGDGTTEGAKGYVTGVSMRFRMWYLTGLLPRITRIEDALSALLPRPAFVKFNTNALLRMDPEQRTAFYQAAQLGQWMTRNEIRAFEDMNPVPGGDTMLKSVQWQENAPAPAPQPEPDDEDDDDEVTA